MSTPTSRAADITANVTANVTAGTTRPAGLLLDADLLRRRRLALGISLRRVATLVGPSMSPTAVVAVEEGRNHPDITLGEVHRICQILGLTLDQVILGPPTSQPTAPDPDPGSGTASVGLVQDTSVASRAEFLDVHVPRLGAILADIGRSVPEQTLADLLDLTLDQVRLVIGELRDRAPLMGLEVFEIDHDIGVRAADTGPGMAGEGGLIERAWRRDLARRGLKQNQAGLVHAAMTRIKTKHLTNDERVQTASLVNAGVLQWHQSGGIELTPATAYSLLITDAHPPQTPPNTNEGNR